MIDDTITREELDDYVKGVIVGLPDGELQAIESVWVSTGENPVYSLNRFMTLLSSVSHDQEGRGIYLLCVIYASRSENLISRMAAITAVPGGKYEPLLRLMSSVQHVSGAEDIANDNIVVGDVLTDEVPVKVPKPRPSAMEMARKAMVLAETAGAGATVSTDRSGSYRGGSTDDTIGVAGIVASVAVVGTLAYCLYTRQTPLDLLNKAFGCNNNTFKIS